MTTSSSDSVKIISPPINAPESFRLNKKGQYYATASDFVSIIESDESDNQPPYFLTKMFNHNQHFVNDDPKKDYDFYNKILLYTRSIYVDHTKSTNNPSEYEYSKLKIIKIFHPRDWKQNWNRPYKFYNNSNRDSIQFTYHDYQKAWQVILLYQNRQNHHSWFLRFEAQDPKQIPNWFYSNWWTLFGPEEQIFPNNVKTFFNKFALEQKFDPEMGHSRYHLLIQFFATYSIPWIIRWEYTIDIDDFPPTFKRTIFCKWWEPYDIQHAFNIQKILSQEAEKSTPHNMSYSDTTNFSSIKKKMKEALQSEGIITEDLFDKKLREILTAQNIQKHDSAPDPPNKPEPSNKILKNPDDEENSFSKAIIQMLNKAEKEVNKPENKDKGKAENQEEEDNMNEDDCFGLI